MVTALKPVRAEQVRWPERKQNGLCHTVGLFCLYALSLRPVGSIHISCLAARQQTSAAQIATKASPPCNMKYFYSFFWHYLSILFLIFFWLKRPSTSARTVVPLTTPLDIGRLQQLRAVSRWTQTCFQYSIPIRDSNRFDSLCESILIDSFCKKIGLSNH